ncbi:hypothetical protein O7599_29805 [Streptomyces sp. WMMC500]|uniref:hypothetical protein n=1 Tax=Streptomyces sp. WMMC500 TaxID=3015154 RepID=UPI00248B140F|nr:hypothetical protein [Streptomyces sp. WMMC500]WBB59709.1 hypothetical protein O7599_29805 [Streptomyces sp. WMMC500]
MEALSVPMLWTSAWSFSSVLGGVGRGAAITSLLRKALGHGNCKKSSGFRM